MKMTATTRVSLLSSERRMEATGKRRSVVYGRLARTPRACIMKLRLLEHRMTRALSLKTLLKVLKKVVARE